MKVFIENEILTFDGEVKNVVKEVEIQFDITDKEFMMADLSGDFKSLRKPTNDFYDFCQKDLGLNTNSAYRSRVYSETYGGDYKFIFYDPRTKCEFVNERTHEPMYRSCYWHKISHEGQEILMPDNF